MDFLTLFGIYVLVVLACIALVCKYSGKQQSPFHTLFNFITKVRNVITDRFSNFTLLILQTDT